MSRAMTPSEKEAKTSLQKTLNAPGNINLMAVLTMADLRLRRLDGELADMTGFAKACLQHMKHDGTDTCPKCMMQFEFSDLPKWRKIMRDIGDPTMEDLLEQARREYFVCPAKKGKPDPDFHV